jgi:phosphoribosylaminoimidazolecarboxamide formyltransferase/IMP cyclohydrolase
MVSAEAKASGPGAKTIRRALLSVTDKTGLVEFAQALAGMGVELISTGGTARALREAGLAVKDISDLTGFPEMLDGRVKTLHPRVHGGLLYIRGNAEHEAAVKAHGIEPIDMVVVNLYAFEKTAAQPGVAFGHLIENIDIGGPSMVRSAAKNFEDVAIVTRVADYPALTEELKANGAALTRPRPRPPRRSTMRRCQPHCASTCRRRRPCATARILISARRSIATAQALALPARISCRAKN